MAQTARISYVDNRDGTLTFCSAQSTDADGQIARREWYVSSESDKEDYTAADSVRAARDRAART